MEKTKPKRTVKIVRSTYQPSKAELEEDANLAVPPGTTPERLAKILLQPAKIRHIDKPKKSR